MPRGWAMLLCAYLLVWVPVGFANELFSTMPSIGRRGSVAIAELLFHGISAASCAAAGWMLLVRNPAAPVVSVFAVVLSSVAAMQSVFWSVLPRQTAPGERLPLVALTVSHALFWVLLIWHYAPKRQRPRTVNP